MGPMVYTKTYIFTYFYSQDLVLFTMVPRNITTLELVVFPVMYSFKLKLVFFKILRGRLFLTYSSAFTFLKTKLYQFSRAGNGLCIPKILKYRFSAQTIISDISTNPACE